MTNNEVVTQPGKALTPALERGEHYDPAADDEYDVVLAKANEEYSALSVGDEKLLSWYVETMGELRMQADLADAEYKALSQRIEELREHRRRRKNEAFVRQGALEHFFGDRVRPLVDAALVEKNTRNDGTLRAKPVKTIVLAAGRVGYRKKAISLDIVDETLAVQWASVNLPDAVKMTVNKSTLSDYAKSAGGKVEIPGTVTKGGHDEFFPAASSLKRKSTPFDRHLESAYAEPAVQGLSDGTRVDRKTGEEIP